MSSYSLRGLHWFNALSAGAKPVAGLPASLKVADGALGDQPVRFIAVVADPDNRFVRAHLQMGVLRKMQGRPVDATAPKATTMPLSSHDARLAPLSTPAPRTSSTSAPSLISCTWSHTYA